MKQCQLSTQFMQKSPFLDDDDLDGGIDSDHEEIHFKVGRYTCLCKLSENKMMKLPWLLLNI